MATTREYIEYVCEQIHTAYPIRYKKMFGEYMVYSDDRPVLLVCDDTVYVKRAVELAELMQNAECGMPYQGASVHYIVDVDDSDLVSQVVEILTPITPLPKKKQAKA